MAGLADPRELTEQRNEVRFATAADDAGIRELLRASVMPGAMRIALTREPSYFMGERLTGANDLTVVARQDDLVIGVGRCSVYDWNRNGATSRIGYLGELRVAPTARESTRLMRDGFDMLSGAAARFSPEGFVTCITTDNTRARRVLEHGGRFGLPSYERLASLVTVACPVSRGISDDQSAACRPDEVDDLTAFLARSAQEAHFTLDWNPSLWESLAVHGVSPEHFRVLREKGRIVAAGCVWDQRPFRQTVIDGYSGALDATRPFVNALQALRGEPGLPAPGTALAVGAVLGASMSDARHWPALRRTLAGQAAQMGLEWLVVTRSGRDWQLDAIRRTSGSREYVTSLYEVRWAGRRSFAAGWDTRPYRPEVGLL